MQQKIFKTIIYLLSVISVTDLQHRKISPFIQKCSAITNDLVCEQLSKFIFLFFQCHTIMIKNLLFACLFFLSI